MGQDAAVAAVDEEVLDAVPQERFAAAIDGEALADAAEIQPHARLEEADRVRSGVQFDEMGADERTGFVEAVFFGHCAGAAGETPGFPQRPGGDVVGPARLPRDLHRQLQQGEKPRLDGNRGLGRGGVDLAQFALRTEDRQLVFQLLDLVEGFQGDFRALGILPGAEANLELAGHGRAGYANQVRLAAVYRHGRSASSGFSSINSASPAAANSRPVT